MKPLEDVYLFEEYSLEYSDVTVRGEAADQNRHDLADVGGLQEDPQVGFVLEQVMLPREPRGYTLPTDPEWSKQWTLVCTEEFMHCYLGHVTVH